MIENSWNLWFPTTIWKINHSIHFILAVSIYWVRLQTQFDLGQHQWNSDPPVAIILLQFVVSNHYLENNDQIYFNYGLAQIRSSGCQKWLKWLKLVVFLNWTTIRVKLGMYIYRVSLQKLFEFRPCCPKFVPLVETNHSIHFKFGVHLCFVAIVQFWSAPAAFRPSGDVKFARNFSFRPWPEFFPVYLFISHPLILR